MDLKNVKPLPIDAELQLAIDDKLKSRISLVGVELEGGWRELPPGVRELVHDGSVFGGRRPPDAPHIGELPLGPCFPAGIGELMRVNYPTKVNDTCGMHVHMSFDSLRYYQILMVPEYQATVLHYLTEWAKGLKTNSGAAVFPENHCMWSRLRGESRFCRIEFWPDIQASTREKTHNMDTQGHRYTVIHYCGRQKTIECRVLPMPSRVPVAIKAVRRLVDITNACIYLLGKDIKQDGFNTKIALPDNYEYEETIVEQL